MLFDVPACFMPPRFDETAGAYCFGRSVLPPARAPKLDLRSLFVVQHDDFMKRALALARQGQGYTSPNPAVGAVVVNDGRIVGEGYHRRAGAPHAEVEALRAADEIRQP